MSDCDYRPRSFLFAKQLLSGVSGPVVQVRLTANQNQLCQFRLIEIATEIGDECGIQSVSLRLTHGIGQVEHGSGFVIEDLGPCLGCLKRLDLVIWNPSSSRRDNMTTQSSGALVNQ